MYNFKQMCAEVSAPTKGQDMLLHSDGFPQNHPAFAYMHDKDDVTIVMVEMRGPKNAHMSDCAGLDIALLEAKMGKPLILLGWMPPDMQVSLRPEKWFAVMGYPNVAFVQLPASADEILDAYNKALEGRRAADPLAIALYGIEQTEDAVRVLRHDLLSATRDQARMDNWRMRARAIFGNLAEVDLVAKVEEHTETYAKDGPLRGQIFPDVCVDVDGTLIDNEGRLREDVLKRAEEEADGGPITIWTGGEVIKAIQRLRPLGVMHKVTSKHNLRDAIVRVIIDDEPDDVFFAKYGVGYNRFIQVT